MNESHGLGFSNKRIGRHKLYAFDLNFKPEEVSTNCTDDANSILTKIQNLENRLNSCDLIYKLSSQTQLVRSKERKEKIQSLKKALNSYKHSIDEAEKQELQLPNNINKTIRNEIDTFISTEAPTELKDLYAEVHELSHNIQELMKKVTLKNKKEIENLIPKLSLIDLNEEESQLLNTIIQNQKELESLTKNGSK